MNKNQRLTLFITAGTLVLMLLFPPYYLKTSGAPKKSYGHHFVLAPPGSTKATLAWQFPIDAELLFVQSLIVISVGGILWFALKTKD